MVQREYNWFREQRVEWIRESVLIFGYINRDHIMQKFSISPPTAAGDLQQVALRWPQLMRYNRNTKRYERNGDSA